MRRGSITTYADDSRRTSMVMASIERRNTSNSIGLRRQELSIDEEFESPKGMFVSFRSIAFVFVIILALLIIAAFAGFYVVSPPEDDLPDGLAILRSAEAEQEPADTYELAASVSPLKYHLELEPRIETERVRLRARARLDFHQSAEPGPSQLTLDARHLDILSHRLEAIQLSKPESGSDSAELRITANKTDEAGSDYVILLENPLLAGNYSLDIEYEAVLDENVAFVMNLTRNGKEILLLASKLKPINAPRLFPTFDEAKFKASFALTLLHPRDTQALSNMPLINSSDASSEDMLATEFAETPRIAAHSLAFVSGSLEQLGELGTEVVSHWASDEHEHHEFYLQDKLSPILEAYAELFNDSDRPTEKLQLVALPLDFDGYSAPGIIVIKESLFYAAVGSPSITKTKALLNLINLVGQQWLGGLVNAKNWTDAWYLEGSLIYLQYALLDKIDQSLEGSDEFLVDVQLEAMENDGYFISKELSSKVDHNRIKAFDLEDSYRKGACLISMLHAIVGEEEFAAGYTDFLQRWSFDIADSEAFLRSFGNNATIGIEGTSLYDVFHTWVRQPGYPLISVKWNRNNGSVVVRQEKFNFDEFSNEDDEDERTERKLRWWLPLTYVTADGNWSKPTLVWLKGTEEMTLDNVGRATNDSWIVFNIDKKGYYRVNYDEAGWEALARLMSAEPGLPPATRAGLVDDALSLARQGSLEYEPALELLARAAESSDYAPWRAIARHAQQLDLALYETSAYPTFQEFMRKLVSRLYDETKPTLEQGSPLAVLALQLACLFEHQQCTSWARSQWENILRDAEYTLAKHVRETVYCVGAQRGGQEELSYLMQKYGETNDRDEKNRLLSALGCFQSPWILQKVLNEILEEHKYDDSDVRVILKSYAKNPAAAQAARRFVQENWREIVKRFSNSYWTMKAFVEAATSLLFSEYDMNEFNAFRDKNIESLKTMAHWVALNEMKASSWIFRLKQSAGNLQQWFKQHLTLVI